MALAVGDLIAYITDFPLSQLEHRPHSRIRPHDQPVLPDRPFRKFKVGGATQV
jgi:hypothetical protein